MKCKDCRHAATAPAPQIKYTIDTFDQVLVMIQWMRCNNSHSIWNGMVNPAHHECDKGRR
jgi:hypothetical protein